MDAYTTHTWRSTAAVFFRLHPHCRDCGAPATQRDHVPPRQILVALGIHQPDHERWLLPRCDTCHARKTRTIDTPMLRRWQAGENPAALADEAMRASPSVG